MDKDKRANGKNLVSKQEGGLLEQANDATYNNNEPFSLRLGTLPEEPDYMKEGWAVDHRVDEIFPNPYPGPIAFRSIMRRIFGPRRKNEMNVRFLPKKVVLNDIEPEFNIGFAGDIMPLFKYDLSFDPSVKEFFSDVELIVANFEGIISVQPAYVMAQRHHPKIMDQLETVKPADKWLLGLSNNHSGDLGLAEYIFMLNRLHWRGFKIAGRKDVPNYLYKDKLNFVTGTEWSNQRDCDYFTRMDEIEDYRIDKEEVMNILFPHWHYEMELYPRQGMVKDAKCLLNNWDMIFGHHSHTPQPITSHKVKGVNKLVAYSGGDFTSGRNLKEHNYGIIAKCKMGRLKGDSKKMAVGEIQWKFVWSEEPHKQGKNEGEPPNYSRMALSNVGSRMQSKNRGKRKFSNKDKTMNVKVVKNCPLFRKLEFIDNL